MSGGHDSRDLVGQTGLLLPDRDQARLQQPCDFGGLLADGANLFLTEKIGQQRLDLAIAVGVELALTLGGEYRREEGLRAAADALDTVGIRLDASVGYRAVVDTHGPPLPIVVQSEQERLGLAAATHPDDDLRSVAAAFVRPGQVLDALGEVDVVVEREAAGPRRRRPAGKQVVGREVVHDRRLAASVGTGDGDQLGTVGEPFEIQRDLFHAQAIADSAEALKGQLERLHEVFRWRGPDQSHPQP